jgi:phosphoenolpyruvate-protein phosphotransferase
MHNVRMALEFTFSCPLRHGLHARPASQMANLANGFLSDFALTNLRSGSTANLKSVLSIIAADIRFNDECVVHVNGADETMARSVLQRFAVHELPRCDAPLQDLLRGQPSRNVPRPLRSAGVEICAGTPVSRGIAEGAVVIFGGLAIPAELSSESPADQGTEQQRVVRALAAVRERIHGMLARRTSATEIGVLQAHLAILGDISLASSIMERITQGRSAGQAIVEASQFFGETLRRSDNLYIRERALDIQEICFELLEEIYGAKRQSLVQLNGPSVLVADNLPPQQLLSLDRTLLKGLVLKTAGITSHTVILARSLGIPALVGVQEPTSVLEAGEHVIIDADRGFLIRRSRLAVRKFYQLQSRASRRREVTLASYANKPAVTTDGHAIEVAANIASADELTATFGNGADGIGLFRTEMLFLDRETAPSEQEQFDVYAEIVRAAQEKPVIIRTLDVGGDKQVGYLNLPAESNPFLGYRGVRVYPDHLKLVRTQLRAIARASAGGRVQMMIPMVSSIEEVRWVKRELVQVRDELTREGIAFDPAMPLGAMIEVPSVAFILDQLSSELDFFSIGTNDLNQYFLAVDRGNPSVAALSDVRRPSFLRFLKHIVDEVHRAGKWVGMCGEMAGELRYLPLLLGLGLDEISVAGPDIPLIKERISRLSAVECRKLLAKALECREVSEVDALLNSCEPTGSRHTLFDRELVLLRSESESKEEAIRELVDAFYVEGRTDDPDRLEQDIWAREELYSTGLGHGFAIPHAKTSAVNASSVGVLKLKKPVEWGSLDGLPVEMVILLAARESDPGGAQMQVFSRLARKLMDETFRSRLLQASGPDGLISFFAEELEVTV